MQTQPHKARKEKNEGKFKRKKKRRNPASNPAR